MSSKEIAFENIILRGLVGSTAHGTGIDGQEDRDEMGIFVEPPEAVCGLTPVEHYIYRTQPEGVRSGPGDLDLTLYSLRKFARLAVQGNPSILLVLWLPDYMTREPIADRLIAMREAFISKEAGKRFLGYLVSQRMRFTGERAKPVSRPELVEQYGYDTKFAMHALRLGLQGAELLERRRISVPVDEPNRSTLLSVRHGEVSYDEALRLIVDAETRLRELIDACDLVVDRSAVDRFLVTAHHEHWAD
jgi:predicted nucleotidyltransferase